MTWALNTGPMLSVSLILCPLFAVCYINITSGYKNTATDISSNTSKFGLHLQNMVLHSFPECGNACLHVGLAVVHASGRLPSWGAWAMAATNIWQRKADPTATALSSLHRFSKNSTPYHVNDTAEEGLDSQTELRALVLLQLNARNAASFTGTSQHRQFGVCNKVCQYKRQPVTTLL